MSLIFLVSSERSGSNFITSIINGHPQVSGPPPSHLFRLFGLNCHNYYPSSSEKNWKMFCTDFKEATENMLGDWNTRIDIESLNNTCPNRSISEALSYLYQSERNEKEIHSFIKENYTYSIIPFILSNWPDAKFIYLVRDPRDVVASWVNTNTVPGGIKQATRTWKYDQVQSIKNIQQIQNSGRAIRIRYEDILKNSKRTCQEICSFIGIEYDAKMLEFYKDERTQRNAERISAWKNLSKPIIKSNYGNYKKILSEKEIRYIELICGLEMKELKYNLNTNIDNLSSQELKKEITLIQNTLPTEPSSKVDSDIEKSIRSKRLNLIDRVKSRVPTQ